MNNKDRLFEVFQKVNKIVLTEQTLPVDVRKQKIYDFIDYACNELTIDEKPTFDYIEDDNYTKEYKSFGGYDPSNKNILIVIVNRNLADILRTLGHELVHHKQNLDGRLNENSGETGSDEENEANSVAGVLMREFGKNNPDIFE